MVNHKPDPLRIQRDSITSKNALEPTTGRRGPKREWRRASWLRVRGQRAIGPSAAPNAHGDLVREVPAFAAERIMEAEVDSRTGAAKWARSPIREAQRKGYRDGDWVEEDQEMVRGTISPKTAGRSHRS